MKQLVLPYKECSPEITISNYITRSELSGTGIYKLVTGETYIRLMSMVYLLPISDAKLIEQHLIQESVQLDEIQPSVITGVSEDALLAAIAIAQDPKLATTILAMRQPAK